MTTNKEGTMEQERVVEKHEATIQWGGVDVEIEIVQRGDGPLRAQLGAFTYYDDEPLSLPVQDVRAIHDLTGRVLASMEATDAA